MARQTVRRRGVPGRGKKESASVLDAWLVHYSTDYVIFFDGTKSGRPTMKERCAGTR